MIDPIDQIEARLRERGDRFAVRVFPNGTMRVATKNGDVKLHWDEGKPAGTLRQAFINAGLLDAAAPAPASTDDEFEDLLG